MISCFKHRLRTLLFVAGIAMAVSTCKKEEEAPVNPYSKVDYTITTNDEVPPDPYSITGLHRNIFSTRCARPGCHDGNFEPDFQTVQSSYSTLVYHRVIKNNSSNTFTYRVVPYDTALSVLHERITNCCFVNPDDRMPQDNIGVPLQQDKIDQITKWILDGAKDANGNINTLPNLKPTVEGYVAVNASNGQRLDTIRLNNVGYNPFVVPKNTLIQIYFLAKDDSTMEKNLLVNKMKTSADMNNFTAATGYTGTYVEILPYKLWRIDLNTASFTPGGTYYFRYYVNDGDHTTDTEFPMDQSLTFYKMLYSFYVQP